MQNCRCSSELSFVYESKEKTHHRQQKPQQEVHARKIFFTFKIITLIYFICHSLRIS
nr:hypothetical protein SHINE37_41211 [Rhizobiaceae bacterium]